MKLKFDVGKIRSVEFLVCIDTHDAELYWQVPVDDDVQEALREMLTATLDQLDIGPALPQFEPGEKYAAVEPSIISLQTDYLAKLRAIYETDRFETNADALSETSQLAFYFAIFTDDEDRRLLGVRRASQFKGTVRARNRLVSIIDDTLTLIDRDVFKLDQDFDYLVSETDVLILRPSGFEYTADVESAMTDHAAEILGDLHATLRFVDFSALKDFVESHKRAARLVASLHARADLNQTSRKLLKEGCRANQIDIKTTSGRISPEKGNELAFLEFLDRRRYPCELIAGEPEYYVAASRRKSSPGP